MSEKPRFQTVNPATGEDGEAYTAHTRGEALEAAGRARQAFEGWRKTSYADRALILRKVAVLLRARKDAYVALMTAEMGKTLTDGRAEIEKCATACDFFADHAADFLKDTTVDVGGPHAFTTFNPLGVVLAIMPWNFPFWQVIRFAAPALMAGNGVVLKHARNVPGCALALEALFRDAGFPEHLFSTVLIPHGEVEALIQSDAIAAVTLTGSVGVGRKVAATAGAALKKVVLELGGADAYLILEDADVDLAAKVCATARMVNAGQSCVAGKRFVVVESLATAFEQALIREMERFQPGDPTLATTTFGPLVSLQARDQIHRQVEASLRAGARLLLGGGIPDRPGAWYPATVLADVAPGQPAHDGEVFGPVAAIIRVKDEAEAIRIANSSEYGLGSCVITADVARGTRIATAELEAGMAFVNANVRSDPRLPFGGVKHSGYGRECSRYGLLEFVNVKTVWIEGDVSGVE